MRSGGAIREVEKSGLEGQMNQYGFGGFHIVGGAANRPQLWLRCVAHLCGWWWGLWWGMCGRGLTGNSPISLSRY